MQINILGSHQRRSILLNIFPLRCCCECCRSAKQSRKSQADGGGSSNRQDQSRWGKVRLCVCAVGKLGCLLTDQTEVLLITAESSC